jgi:hypothetical protein
VPLSCVGYVSMLSTSKGGWERSGVAIESLYHAADGGIVGLPLPWMSSTDNPMVVWWGPVWSVQELVTSEDKI